jgi:hypothetical protein
VRLPRIKSERKALFIKANLRNASITPLAYISMSLFIVMQPLNITLLEKTSVNQYQVAEMNVTLLQ